MAWVVTADAGRGEQWCACRGERDGARSGEIGHASLSFGEARADSTMAFLEGRP